MRFLYKICRLLLLCFYFPSLFLTRKYPKYRDRLKLYRYELRRRFFAGRADSFKLQILEGIEGESFKMLLRSPGKIEDQLIALRKFENHITAIMPRFMLPGTAFLDIGANIGFHTFNVLAHHPDAEAYCFEPNPEIKYELDRNVRLNNWQTRITTTPLALSDAAGEFDFFIMPQAEKNRGMSSLIAEAVDSRFKKIRVKAEPFDVFWNKLKDPKKRVSLVKIDTQGNEEGVLRGMLGLIESDRPTLFLEFETHLVKDKARLWELYRSFEKTYAYDFFIIDKSGFGLTAISFETLPIKDYSIDIIGIQGLRST